MQQNIYEKYSFVNFQSNLRGSKVILFLLNLLSFQYLHVTAASQRIQYHQELWIILRNMSPATISLKLQ